MIPDTRLSPIHHAYTLHGITFTPETPVYMV